MDELKKADLSKPETFKSHFDSIGRASVESIGALLVRTANEWVEEAKNRPIPRKLFDSFWFEGELCILFADTNLGKSILAVQIGDSISKGLPIDGFWLEVTTGQEVLYFDFELSDKQFENRYSKDYKDHYRWDDRFKRVEISPDAITPEGKNFEDYLFESIEKAIISKKAKILIVDNITYLRTQTETAKDAMPLMKGLKELKRRFDLSILALAHTPKRDLSKPVTRNDLQGSKMLINFCDSAFCIGESANDTSLRYLKQIKVRSSETLYTSDNVVTCQITKPYNFLGFEKIGFSNEKEHLKERTEKDREAMIERAKELQKQGHTQRDIATTLGCSVGAVNKYLKM